MARSFWLHAVVTALSGLLYLGYNWIAYRALRQVDTRTFLLPLLAMIAAASYLAQVSLDRLLAGEKQAALRWLLIGPQALLHQLQRANRLSWHQGGVVLVPWSGQADLSAIAFEGVIVAHPEAVTPQLQAQLLEVMARGIPLLSPRLWCESFLQRLPVDLITSADLFEGGFAMPRRSLQVRLKRVGDVVVSGSLLLVALPLLLVAALCIVGQDRGPVFYSQLRSGVQGKPFRIWKLRTMRLDAERQGAQWVQRQDSRITPVGRLLRQTRLDELPQLLSVLRGDMSLIGPRPERPEFDVELERQIPHYRLRYWMRPGLSGWAQVNYPYGASIDDAANKLSYDLFYLRHFSFWLDLLILLKTIRLVFNAQGAVPLSPVEAG